MGWTCWTIIDIAQISENIHEINIKMQKLEDKIDLFMHELSEAGDKIKSCDNLIDQKINNNQWPKNNKKIINKWKYINN